MKITVITGSPRKKGNPDGCAQAAALADKF